MTAPRDSMLTISITSKEQSTLLMKHHQQSERIERTEHGRYKAFQSSEELR